MPAVSDFGEEKAKIKLELPEEDSDLYDKYIDMFEDDVVQTLEDLIGKNTEDDEMPTTLVLDKFFLTRNNLSMPDRAQVIETNEYPIMFSFGEGAEIYQFEVSIFSDKRESTIHGELFDWVNIFRNFHKISRATIIIDFDLDFRIEYADNEYVGVWHDLQLQQNARNDKINVGNFKFFVSKKKPLPIIEREEEEELDEIDLQDQGMMRA